MSTAVRPRRSACSTARSAAKAALGAQQGTYGYLERSGVGLKSARAAFAVARQQPAP